MDLIALADFVAVVRHGGFGPASRATGQPKATLSRRVRALEIELGVRLIERGSRNLRLSEEGEALHRRAAHLVGELAEIGDELVCASQAPRGRLRVSVPAALAGPMLGSLAARFVAAYPDVSVEIVAEDRFVDLVADGFDIVVRANPAPDSALVGQCIRRSYEVVAAHPDMPLPPMSNEPVPVARRDARRRAGWRHLAHRARGRPEAAAARGAGARLVDRATAWRRARWRRRGYVPAPRHRRRPCLRRSCRVGPGARGWHRAVGAARLAPAGQRQGTVVRRGTARGVRRWPRRRS